MPTYEYRCSKCHNHFEEFQKMTDPPVKVCPSCGGSVEKLFSAGAGLLFKGSGFYITDYRSDSYKKKAKEEKGPTAPASKPAPTGSSRKKKKE